jgi:hypothetical protein
VKSASLTSTTPHEANKAPEPTITAVTFRAPSSTARASRDRGSSLTLAKMKLLVFFLLSLVAATTAAERPMREAGTLFIFSLTVESSYAKNFERPAGAKFDTLQWWIGSHGAWRIKTYAVDADIHPYRIDTAMPKDDLRKMVVENSKKHYGDVIRTMNVIEIPADASDERIAALLKKEGLRPTFEWVNPGYFLWLPDASKYATKTKPKQG